MAAPLNDFPILSRLVHDKPLVYLDNAATSQKPKIVIDSLVDYYTQHNSNVHRSVHQLAAEATEAYEGSRSKVAAFIGGSASEIVFTKNTSEACNLVMRSWAWDNLKEGDEIILTITEHHSNLVPWQQLQTKGVELRYLDINDEGRLRLDQFKEMLSKKTKLVCITHASNVLGTINPVKEMIQMSHEVGALVLLDSAQSVPHIPVDVKDLDCDFMTFSAHKMLGPTGVGVLFGKRTHLESMQPFLFGGEMIKSVSKTDAKWNDIPWKFEAGTPNIAGVIAFGEAIDYLSAYGIKRFAAEEKALVERSLPKLLAIPGIKLFGPHNAKDRLAVFAFALKGIHPHDVASIVDSEGIAIRSGHACAQPLMERLGVDSVARASAYIYNTDEDIDALVDALKKAIKVFE